MRRLFTDAIQGGGLKRQTSAAVNELEKRCSLPVQSENEAFAKVFDGWTVYLIYNVV